MKKGSVRASGIITIIFSIIFIVFAFLFIGNALQLSFVQNIISQGVISTIFFVGQFIFIYPLIYLLSVLGVESNSTIVLIISIVFAVFSLLMFFWGIKETSIAKKDDDSFRKCKKTCGFANFIKFMFFAYFLALIIISFVDSGLKEMFDIVSSMVGVNFIIQIILAIIALISFICFLLPVIAYNQKLENELRSEDLQGNVGENSSYNQEMGVQNEQENQQDGYQNQFYSNQQQQTTPIDPYDLVHAGEAEEEPRIVPGKDGIPVNITQKGLDDLARLERLRASGAIDEKNYAVLKQKICSTNLS